MVVEEGTAVAEEGEGVADKVWLRSGRGMVFSRFISIYDYRLIFVFLLEYPKFPNSKISAPLQPCTGTLFN